MSKDVKREKKSNGQKDFKCQRVKQLDSFTHNEVIINPIPLCVNLFVCMTRGVQHQIVFICIGNIKVLRNKGL